MKMKHNFNFYITSTILCCLSLVGCPSPLSDTSESAPPSTDASSECDESCQSNEVCHLGQCATASGQLGEPCPKSFSLATPNTRVTYGTPPTVLNGSNPRVPPVFQRAPTTLPPHLRAVCGSQANMTAPMIYGYQHNHK